MNKTRQWAMLTAVACLAILAIGFFVVVKPQRSHASSLRTQAQTVRAQSAELQSQVDQLRQQQKDLPAQQKLLSQIATKVPDNPALPSLIRQLSAAADGAGVDLVSLAPSVPTMAQTQAPGSAAAKTAATSATTTKPSSAGTAAHRAGAAAPLAIIPLTLQVKGSYFNVEQFFSAVENLSRALRVTGFTLAGKNNAGTTAAPSTGAGAAGAAADPPGTLIAQITAQVYESPQLAAVSPVTSASTTTTGK